MTDNEELAIIEAVGVGARDVGSPVLWFDVTGDGWAALQVFRLDDDKAKGLLSSVYEAHELNGRACVVSKADGIVRFERLLKKPPRR